MRAMAIPSRKKTVPLLDLLNKQAPGSPPLSAPAPIEVSAPPSGPTSAPQSAPAPVASAEPTGQTSASGKPVVRITYTPRTRPAMTPIKVEPIVQPMPADTAASIESSPRKMPVGAPLPGVLDKLLPGALPKALIALALLIAVGVGVWYIAFHRGQSQAQREVEPLLQRTPTAAPSTATSPPTTPTTTAGTAATPRSAPSATEARRTTTTPASTPAPATSPAPRPASADPILPAFSPGMFDNPAPPAGAVLTANGWSISDPRQQGMNYLVLLSRVPRQEAGEAVLYLNANGVQAFAVPLEKTGANANNPARDMYALYAGPGLSKADLDRRSAGRTATEEAVARLGRAWMRQFRKPHDFRDPFWERF